MDALGRQTGESSPLGIYGKGYDAAGRLNLLVWPDNFYVNYDYNAIGNVTAIRENGATSGAGVLAQYSYDSLGRRTGIVRGNGNNTGIGYDTASRLQSIGHDFPGTANDVGWGYGYNPAGQLKEAGRNNDAYAWGGHYNAARTLGANGLNQLTTQASVSGTTTTNSTFGYDLRGNLATSATGVDMVQTTTYGYNSLNQLVSLLPPGAATATSVGYDPIGRLSAITMPVNIKKRFSYIGGMLATEHDSIGTILRRYVPGPGTDEPLVWYEGAGTADRRWLHADERGSVVSVSDAGGNVIAINRYDEYGVPAATNLGRFQYTGQAWLPELGMYYYKARMYSPTLGRFMQTDPIGYGDGLNWYNYVGGDPVNATDPTGLVCLTVGGCGPVPGGIDVNGRGHTDPCNWGSGCTSIGGDAWNAVLERTPGVMGWREVLESLATGLVDQAEKAKQYAKRCVAGTGSISAGETARAGVRGAVRGAAQGGARALVLTGPEGVPVAAAGGALTGMVTSSATSAVKQACQAGNGG
ncbi:MAG: RHS repeat-associated core domain-containing protein [Sphingorhabdus sp.]